MGTGNDFLKNFGGDMDKFRDAENLWNGPQFPMGRHRASTVGWP